MNQADQQPNYKTIYNQAKALFEKTTHFANGPFDETYYSMRVYEWSKKLADEIEEDINKEVLLTAALLHDTGKSLLDEQKTFKEEGEHRLRPEEWHKHALLGEQTATTILKKQGHSDEFIKKVCTLIKRHDERHTPTEEKNIELQLLQDADLLADIGFAGFIRPFLYSGKFHQTITRAIRYNAKEDRTREGKLLNLELSKTYAKKLLEEQRTLAKMGLETLDSDVLD